MRNANWMAALGGGALVVGSSLSAQGAAVVVTNPSFESPVVDPLQQASPGAAGWNSPGPVIDPGTGLNLNAGIFPNSASGQPGHLDNVDGNQVAFLGSQSGNEFNQTLTSSFEAGQSYALTVALGKSLFLPPAATDGVRLQLFYVDGSNARQSVASLDVLNDAATNVRNDALQDFTVTSPVLMAGDAAVGKPIGVALTTTGAIGGFFDLDNVRIDATAVPEPTGLLTLAAVGALGLLGRRRRQI